MRPLRLRQQALTPLRLVAVFKDATTNPLVKCAFADKTTRGPNLEALFADKKASCGALVESLVTEYHEAMNTDFKQNALLVVLRKLDEVTFKKNLIGIVEPSAKETAAKKEAARRLSAESLQSLHERYVQEIVKGKLRDPINQILNRYFSGKPLADLFGETGPGQLGATWANADVANHLGELQEELKGCVEATLLNVGEFWRKALQEVLTAETTVKNEGGMTNLLTKSMDKFLSFFSSDVKASEMKEKIKVLRAYAPLAATSPPAARRFPVSHTRLTTRVYTYKDYRSPLPHAGGASDPAGQIPRVHQGHPREVQPDV